MAGTIHLTEKEQVVVIKLCHEIMKFGWTTVFAIKLHVNM